MSNPPQKCQKTERKTNLYIQMTITKIIDYRYTKMNAQAHTIRTIGLQIQWQTRNEQIFFHDMFVCFFFWFFYAKYMLIDDSYHLLWLDGSVRCRRILNLAHNHANRTNWATAHRCPQQLD